MNPRQLAIGDQIRINKPDLQQLIAALDAEGYRVVGPQAADGTIVYDDLSRVDQLPLGYLDEQDGGKYRLHQVAEAGYFDHVAGPHSLKRFVFPPRETLLHAQRDTGGNWQMSVPEASAERIAVIGMRACDLHALQILDRTLLEGAYVDRAYEARRKALFLVAVNCRRAAPTCFCHSMGTGPAVGEGADLALSENDSHFLIQVGSQRGCEVAGMLDYEECTAEEVAGACQQSLRLKASMEQRAASGEGRSLETSDVYQLLMNNLEHPRWNEVAERCLACANCTMVCPTCFCVSVEEVSDLTGENIERQRVWDSCFTAGHSYMTSGSVRKSIASRYRQWLTHKLATWHDQFDTSGCVGCGRCISWCPVGIDLTEEVAVIRGGKP